MSTDTVEVVTGRLIEPQRRGKKNTKKTHMSAAGQDSGLSLDAFSCKDRVICANEENSK